MRRPSWSRSPAAGLLVAACTPGEPATSLVLVTLDTTRADRVGAYGHAGAATPHLDALADAGVRFEHAYATVPLTTPSHASMLTGLYPTRHGVRVNGDAAVPQDLSTLAEHAAAAGHATGASVGAYVTGQVWGLDQGFESFSQGATGRRDAPGWSGQRDGAEVIDDALAWLDTVPADDPFVLWVHLYDPHLPRAEHPGWTPPTDDPYDAELAWADKQTGRLLEIAAARGPLAVLAIGDHGEALGSDHELTHGMFLYDDTTRVPLLITGPDVAPGVVSNRAATTADVLPTALGLLGLPIPDDLDGVDLLSPDPRPRDVFLESDAVRQRLGFRPERAVVSLPWKLMDGDPPALYRLPDESHDVATAHPDVVARLRDALDAHHATRPDQALSAPPDGVTAALEALGYMAPAAAPVGSGDAKQHRAVVHALEGIRGRIAAGAPPDELAAAFAAVLDLAPEAHEAQVGLAMAQLDAGRPEAALEPLRAVIAADPDATGMRLLLADALAGAGALDEALHHVIEALRRVPGEPRARVLALQLLADTGRATEAWTRAQTWLSEAAPPPDLAAQAGLVAVKVGEQDRGRALLEQSLADGLPRPYVHRTLAWLEANRGDVAAAVTLAREEARLFPSDAFTWQMLRDLEAAAAAPNPAAAWQVTVR